MKGDILLCILVIVIVVLVVVCLSNKNTDNNPPPTPPDKNEPIQPNPQDNNSPSEKIEDAYELLGNIDSSEAFKLGFGSGPGLYGSGRHIFEMDIL